MSSWVAGPMLPAYGAGSLTEVAPSLLAAVRGDGDNPLGVLPARAIVLLLIDGLGWELLLAHQGDAPFLAAQLGSGRPITSGYPSSTATSLAMLSTARPPLAHGLTGYTMAAPGLGVAMNNLAWTTHGPGARDLRAEVPPEEVQPLPTFAQSPGGGVTVTVVAPAEHEGSGLTRAILRGGRYVGVRSIADPEAVDAVAAVLRGPSPALAYAYYPAVDGAGHRWGPGSAAWREEVRRVDAAAAALAAVLPDDGALAVTADHGMVDLSTPDAHRVEVSEHPELSADVRFLAGEARARHVHTVPGRASAVLERWRGALGERAWVLSRDEAIEAGWFGPPDALRDGVAERIGDVVCAAADRLGVFQRLVDPGEASLAGHHGSLTPAEVLVPWIVVRR